MNTMKMSCHSARRGELICPMAKAVRPPNAPASAENDQKKPSRNACSLRLYHKDV